MKLFEYNDGYMNIDQITTIEYGKDYYTIYFSDGRKLLIESLMIVPLLDFIKTVE